MLAGVGTVIAAQFVFTYAPFMHGVFATRPVSLADGVNIVILGIVFFAILELDKLVRRRLRFLAD